MREIWQYRLSKIEKNEIALNLINILKLDAPIHKQTREFLCNWILTGPDEKRKAFYDVWDIVLKNYLPLERPVLFRSCEKIYKNNRISSFTGRLECAKRFSNGLGLLIICDTHENLKFEDEFYTVGTYRNSFYPLASVLQKAKAQGGWGFSERLLNNYIGEDEYIMRVDLEVMSCVQWAS